MNNEEGLTSAALPEGAMLMGGKYRIVRKLGQGGFGITYLAEHVELEKRVAIKEFFFGQYCERDSDTSSVTVPTAGNRELVEKFRRKFVKEAKLIASKLSHPSIVRVSDVFSENGTSYYVMDYIDGCSLADIINERGRMGETEAIGIIDSVGKALEFVHSRNINHLDIKPGNIMVEAETGNVVLIDFGVAKQYDAETGEATTTTPVARSRGYAPPEQYKPGGVGSFTPESDIYALGATLYKMVTGTTPPDAMEVAAQGGIPPLPDSISAPVRRAITAAMQTAKKDRPHTVAEFLGILHGKAVGEETEVDKEKRKQDDIEVIVIDDGRGGKGNNDNNGGNAERERDDQSVRKPQPEPQPQRRKWLQWAVAAGVAVVAFVAIMLFRHEPVNPGPDSIPKPNLSLPEIEMVYVPGGMFTMGATSEQESDAYDDEKPAHSVTLSGYYIGKYEVTQAQWKAVMGSNPSHFKGDNLPVELVSWDDVQTFIKKLNQMTGKSYRLPTEAEWEYAARGGSNSSGYKYSGSDNIHSVAWYSVNSDDTTHPVGRNTPNELGIYDMSGNVYEWCHDWSGSYSSASQRNPQGPASGSFHVYRGGGWSHYDRDCRVSRRSYGKPDSRFDYLGFRLAL